MEGNEDAVQNSAISVHAAITTLMHVYSIHEAAHLETSLEISSLLVLQ